MSFVEPFSDDYNYQKYHDEGFEKGFKHGQNQGEKNKKCSYDEELKNVSEQKYNEGYEEGKDSITCPTCKPVVCPSCNIDTTTTEIVNETNEPIETNEPKQQNNIFTMKNILIAVGVLIFIIVLVLLLTDNDDSLDTNILSELEGLSDLSEL